MGRRADEAAVAIARDRGGSLPRRIACRASLLDDAAGVRADIARLRRLLDWMVLVLAVIGLVAGGLAARASVVDRQVDILLATAALLLVPTALLLAWVVLMALGGRRRGSGSIAGGLAMAGLRWLGPRVLQSRHAADLMSAFAAATSRASRSTASPPACGMR